MEDQIKVTKDVNTSGSRPERLKRILSLAFLALVLGASIYLASRYSLEEIKQFMREHPQWIALISFGVYVVWSMTLVPSFPLTAFLALTLGPLQATLLGTLGMSLSGMLEYLMGAQVNQVLDFEKYWQKLPQKLQAMPLDSTWFLILGRMLPAGPKVVSTLAGARKINLWRYVWTTLVVSFTGAVLPAYVAVGILRI